MGIPDVVRMAHLAGIGLLVVGGRCMAQDPPPGAGPPPLEGPAPDFVPDQPPLPPGARDMPSPVVLWPAEVLLLRTDVPHDSGYRLWVPPDVPGGEWLEYGDVYVSHWSALGGRLLSVDQRTVLYEAPTSPGVAILEWNDGVSEPITLAFIVPGGDESWDEQVALAEEVLDQDTGSYLPVTGGTSFRVFAVHPCPAPAVPGQRPCGEGFTYASNVRLNPPLSNTECTSGSKSTYRYKAFVLPPSFDKRDYIGRLRVGGVEADVYRERSGWTRRMQLWDCYECRNGQWVWCGNKLATWFTYHQSYDPSFICGLPGYNCGPQQSQKQVFRTRGGCCP